MQIDSGLVEKEAVCLLSMVHCCEDGRVATTRSTAGERTGVIPEKREKGYRP